MERRIETERLILRPLEEKDAADVFEWVGDPVVNRYMPYTLYQNVEQARAWICSITPQDCEFAFVLKETGQVIGAGSIGLNDEGKYELGYNLNRAFWGQGFATEAARAMIDWAYDQLGARDFAASYATANAASGHVLRKCGFQFERFGRYSRFDGSETFDATFVTLHMDEGREQHARHSLP